MKTNWASVMAHEIAHITQRHLPRMLAKAEASKLPTIAAVVASVLVGGKAGLAGLTVANAALLSNQLSYTRDFEREADSIGIKLLAESGFDPTAMSRFFNKIDRHGVLGDETPEFLRTHPLSYTRIAEAENRASAYPPADHSPSRAFHLAKAKIRALYLRDDRDAVAYFSDRAQNTSGEEKIAAQYGLALAHKKSQQVEPSRAALQPLLEAYPNEVAFSNCQRRDQYDCRRRQRGGCHLSKINRGASEVGVSRSLSDARAACGRRCNASEARNPPSTASPQGTV